MAGVSAQDVKDLRTKTGAGMMDCKKALAEAGGDLEKAHALIRAKGKQIAEKRAGKETREGAVFSYIHPGSKVGVLLEIGCETDFVARTDKFQELGREISMQIAAMNPKYVTRDEIDRAEIEKEIVVYKAEAIKDGKPENIAEKIAQGRVDKMFAEMVLTEQAFVKGDKQSVKDIIEEVIAQLGEKIEIRRFNRFQVGAEG